jgi:hypothetical protein
MRGDPSVIRRAMRGTARRGVTQQIMFRPGVGYTRGDPFFGAILGALPLVSKIGGGLVKGAAKLFGGKSVTKAVQVAAPKVLKGMRGPIGTAVIGGAAAGVAGGLIGRMGGGSAGGRRRSMQVTNVHALRRACRRVEGFAKLAKRTIQFTQTVRMKSRRKRKC